VRGSRKFFILGVWAAACGKRTTRENLETDFRFATIGSIGAIAVAPSDSNVLYVGSAKRTCATDLLRERDVQIRGWRKNLDASGLRDSRQIGRILVDPRDRNKVFVAALGHAYGPNAERGVFRSTTEEKLAEILFHDENTGAIDLAFEPGNTKTIYAALCRPGGHHGAFIRLRMDREADSTVRKMAAIIGRGDGTWIASEGLGRIGIAFAPSSPAADYLIWTRRKAGCTARTTAGRIGSASRTTSGLQRGCISVK